MGTVSGQPPDDQEETEMPRIADGSGDRGAQRTLICEKDVQGRYVMWVADRTGNGAIEKGSGYSLHIDPAAITDEAHQLALAVLCRV